MNILLYNTYIDKSFGGVLQYSKCLLTILQQDKKNNYFILLRNNFDEFSEFKSTENFTILPKEETDYRSSLFSIFELLLFNFLSILEKLKISIPVDRPNGLKKIISKYKIDVLHSPYQYIPEVNIPTLVTLHDVQELHFPEFFSPEIRARRAELYLSCIKNSSKIIVSYSHIKQDIIKYFNTPEDKIEVVLLNMQNLWFEKFNHQQLQLNPSISFPENFILYPAATWEHKNHKNLLKAIQLLKLKYNTNINLVCTGHQTAYFSQLESLIIELAIENQVFFLGKISENDLYFAYQNCKAIIIPTLYEAGSFPLMEAILLEVPCVCSNITSLPETMDNPDYIFDPNNIEEIAEKILKITTDEAYRMAELQHFKKLQKNLTNTHSLETFTYIYDSIAKY